MGALLIEIMAPLKVLEYVAKRTAQKLPPERKSAGNIRRNSNAIGVLKAGSLSISDSINISNRTAVQNCCGKT